MSVDYYGTANIARVPARQNLTHEVVKEKKNSPYTGVIPFSPGCGQLTPMWFGCGSWRKCTEASSIARSVCRTRTTIVVVVDGT